MNPLSRLLILLLAAPFGAAASEPRLSFNRDIRPILSDRCYHCHGPDGSHRKADLRLDIRSEETLLVLAPGEVRASEVVKRIFSADAEEVMPPPESHKALTLVEKETIRRWVAEGATYEPHWAYAALERPGLPDVGVSHPVDAFVLEKLIGQQTGLSPEAPKDRLLRRLSLDLTGLPPTEAERTAFLADNSFDAYERQVDRLLASPHFGERMAVWWLDIARFSDTVGFHGDQNQRIFPYRDYVIAAFNANKPFDQFTVEQLAGDLLLNPTTEQRVATGYNRLNMMTREGGAQAKEYLAKYGGERVRSVAAAWLGSTFGCAECHDHKFDPIATRDFYELQAFFADVKQWGIYHDYNYTPNPELRGFSNDHPFPPELLVDSPYLQAKERNARDELLRYVAAITPPAESPGFSQWLAESREFLRRQPGGWIRPDLGAQRWKKDERLESDGLEVTADGALALGRATKSGEEVRLTLTPTTGWIASLRIRLEGVAYPVDAEASGLRVMALEVRSGGTSRKLKLHFAEANHQRPRYRNGIELPGVTFGWRLPADDPGEPLTSVWVLDHPFEVQEGEELVLRLGYDVQAKARMELSPWATLSPRALMDESFAAALAAPAEMQAPAQRTLLAEAWLASTAADRPALERARKLSDEVLESRGGKAWTLVTEPAEPLTVRVLPRGNWQDESGPVVLPATPSFLPGRRVSTEGQRLTRLDLAHWLMSDDNPLTARTVVNRLWQPFFGTALSAVVDDLGSQGELPSHPALLDWLACEFRDSGWDLKHLIRTLVTSRTYRQSSNLRPDLRDADPGNRLLAAQNPRRLDAEFIRDNALSIAGMLDLGEIGGPSARPYQPEGHYEALQFPDRDYVASGADEQWRRGVYMHWQRTFLHPMLVNFDAPNRDECTALRTLSNTPQQALTLLNDPTFVEAARVFAARLLEGPGASDAERLDRAFLLAVGRPPKAADRDRLLAFLGSQTEHYTKNADEARRLLAVGLWPASKRFTPATAAAWTQVCRVVLNAQETITRY